MALSLEERVEVLEVKVGTLETDAGPGRAEAQSANLADLRAQFARFGEVQAKQSQTLDIHTGKFSGLDRSVISLQFDVGRLATNLTEFKDESSGKLERLDHDVDWLKGTIGRQEGLIIALSADVTDLKDDITGLRNDVTELRNDFTELRNDVTELKNDFTELRNDVTELRNDFTELRNDFTELKNDVTELRGDFTELKNDFTELRGDFTELRDNVTELRNDFTEFKVEVRGALAQILDRLPAKAA